MTPPSVWPLRRIPALFSVSLLALYFGYIALCVYAPTVLGEPAMRTSNLSWAVLGGIGLLLITVIMSVFYFFTPPTDNDKIEGSGS